MPKYKVLKPELWIYVWIVEAENEEEAKRKVAEGDARCSYNHPEQCYEQDIPEEEWPWEVQQISGYFCDVPRCLGTATWLLQIEDEKPAYLCDDHIGPQICEARRPYTHKCIRQAI